MKKLIIFIWVLSNSILAYAQSTIQKTTDLSLQPTIQQVIKNNPDKEVKKITIERDIMAKETSKKFQYVLKIEKNREEKELICSGACDDLLNGIYYSIGSSDTTYLLGTVKVADLSKLEFVTKQGDSSFFQVKAQEMIVKEFKVLPLQQVTQADTKPKEKVTIEFESINKASRDTQFIISVNKKVPIYENNRCGRAKEVALIKSVNLTIRDGNIVETFIYTDSNEEFFCREIVSLLNNRKDRTIKCKLKHADYYNECKKAGLVYLDLHDVLRIKSRSYGLYRPNNEYNRTIDAGDSLYLYREDKLDNLLKLSIYSDVLGLLNYEDNPIATVELSAFQRPNTKPIERKTNWIMFHYLRERMRIKRFDNAESNVYSIPTRTNDIGQSMTKRYYNPDKSDSLVVNQIKIDKALLLQKEYFNFDVTLGLLDHWLYTRHRRTPHRFHLDFFYGIGLANVKHNINDTTMSPSTRLLLYNYGAQLGARINFSERFNMRLNFKLFKQDIYRVSNITEPFAQQIEEQFEDNKLNYFTKFELGLNYDPPKSKHSLFFRSSFVNNHNPFVKGPTRNNLGTLFLQLQVGYTRDLSQLFTGAFSDIK